MKILVTGSAGFIGRNLTFMIKQQSGIEIVEYDLGSQRSFLDEGLETADVIFHLAGINRPDNPEDYFTGNTVFTRQLCNRLSMLNRKPMIIFSSSIQAGLENPYGVSKRGAEEELIKFSEQTGARLVIFRLKNAFGKWCRPNYNSAVATFCHNIARNLPVSISDPAKEVNLVYVDDICMAMMEVAGLLQFPTGHVVSSSGSAYADIAPAFKITLGALVDTIYSFKATRSTLQVPVFDDPFVRRLYATYLSYLAESDFSYGLDIKTDNRGNLAEFLKSASFGQIFVSRTKPGITRGNHYHHTKTEKFLVVQGQAVIRFRNVKVESERENAQEREQEPSIIEYRVSGDELRVVDIPPGYTHSIENVGEGELVTLFWANEVFDPNNPDTFFCEV